MKTFNQIVENKFDNNLKDKILSLHLDEIDKEIIINQTKDYAYYNKPSFFNIFNDKYNKDYSLLESITRSYPILTIKNHIKKKYNPSF